MNCRVSAFRGAIPFSCILSVTACLSTSRASACLEGEVPFENFVQFVESKLPLIPRYLKRLVAPPLNIGLPSWEFDPDFDIRYHVREVTLKHGSDSELKTLAGKILGKVMDRRHPLWDFTFVHGLKGNRSAVIIRLHHCLADGIAGISLMNVLMDVSPVAPALPKRRSSAPSAATARCSDFAGGTAV